MLNGADIHNGKVERFFPEHSAQTVSQLTYRN